MVVLWLIFVESMFSIYWYMISNNLINFFLDLFGEAYVRQMLVSSKNPERFSDYEWTTGKVTPLSDNI